MKILLVHPYLEIFDRYFEQMKAISEKINKFHVAYCSGKVKREWENYFIFHKFMDFSYNPKKVGWKKNILRLPSHLKRLEVSKAQICKLNVNVDLVYVLSSFWQQFLASNFALKNNIPCVARVRGHLLFELKIKESFLTRMFYSSTLKRNLKNVDLIIPITKRVRNDLIYWGLKNLSEPVGLGVNCKQFFPLKKAGCFKVGFAGRLSEEKGINHLIEIALKMPDTIFLVAGRKQTVLNLPRNLIYLGRLPHNEMTHFYQSVDLILMPSLTEGFPNVLLEAYACGVPVVVSEVALPSELKLFGLKGKNEEFPLMIETLKKQNLNVLGRKAREYVKKNYTWEKFGEKIVKCFKHLI